MTTDTLIRTEPHRYGVYIRFWADGNIEDHPGQLRYKEVEAWTAADALTQVQVELRGETAVIERIAPEHGR